MIKEGIININKPKGYTSHDCVNVIRSLSGVKRVGHTGTLDPMAEGVLPVCIGSAARIMEYLDMDIKIYRCEATLGLESDTLDIWGEITQDNTSEAEQLILSGDITEAAIAKVLNRFLGTIEQIPPKYSALKVNGRKLYEYARSGEEVEIASRKVYIWDIRLLETNLAEKKFIFEVSCSKGTYIRSLCRDIGEILGCGALMSGLIRLASGVFSIEESVDIEELKKLKQGEDVRDSKTGRVTCYARALPEELNSFISNADFPLVHFGKIIVDDNRVKWFCDGGSVAESQVKVHRMPKYKEEKAFIEIRNEFKNAYNAYADRHGDEVFLGVAFFDAKTKTFKADKIFGRG